MSHDSCESAIASTRLAQTNNYAGAQ